jgi:hypothetical protein
MLRQLLVVLAVTIAAGAVAGLVWEWLWTPPVGVVVDHHWVLDEAGLRDDFSGTGTYIAVAAVVGVLVGALVALLFDRAELVTLVAVVVGSVVAGWLMYRVGLTVGPPDPRGLARTAEEGAHLPGQLEVLGCSSFVAFPSGALVGLVVVFLGLSRRRPTDG